MYKKGKIDESGSVNKEENQANNGQVDEKNKKKCTTYTKKCLKRNALVKFANQKTKLC